MLYCGCTGGFLLDDFEHVVSFQALYLLLNCEHNLDEALRRHKLQSVPPSGEAGRDLVGCETVTVSLKSLLIILEKAEDF